MHGVFSQLAGFSLLAVHALAVPSPVPQFEVLMSGPIVLSDSADLVAGPFGSRLNAPILEGNLTDTSGNLVAAIVPGTSADHGLVAADGTFFPDGCITIQWTVDSKSAYLHAQGVGHVETDFPTWNSLNSRFLLANFTFETAVPTLTLFGVV
ncbi:hypothetical protein CERSUDRAFT_75830 [Gelatoporia subvermispora B]|uniref:Uncharacterized protein n=1 Tax=Ceriporiopsis subvermispora (strain B) TaxID=914234 RepID=M2QPZ1_CERS8|nr:hypothetical protein CERSUDRAFT_75830 [Gelatoporia subvermispora B]